MAANAPIISAVGGAAQIVLLPNIIGIQNMAIAFVYDSYRRYGNDIRLLCPFSWNKDSRV